jgi:hypothetical protein
MKPIERNIDKRENEKKTVKGKEKERDRLEEYLDSIGL